MSEEAKCQCGEVATSLVGSPTDPVSSYDLVKYTMGSFFAEDIKPEDIHHIELIPNKQVNIVTKEGSGQRD